MVFGNDVFVHSRQLGRFQAGQQVEFAVFLGRDNMPQAYDLQDPAAPVARVGGMLLMQQQALVQQQLVATGGAGALGAASAPAACLGGAALAGTMPAALGQAVPVLPGVLPAGPPQPGPPPGAPPPRKRPRPSDSQVIGQYQGVVTSFSAANGFGFIACDAVRAMGHQNDVLLHHSEAAGVEVGRQVRFTCFLNGKGSPEAMDLTLAGGVPPMQPVPGSHGLTAITAFCP
ncbi:unnamed protein product [Prorocentrum cordatum]|uniref:CSD domain-containing protein n=1 Tax=Prorocentrum cordatum TaxID=2364126 RepID=A0ABN9V7R9_9DINO|nr:unnamed protein product [Polarella glacialis]